jgi:acetoacetate decarboxylase
MPLAGTLDVTGQAARAPVMESLHTDPLVLERAEILQVMFEIDDSDMEALLPAALHPTIPPTVTFVCWHVPDSPWGPFALGQVRVGCRAGVRPRGYLLSAVVDHHLAAEALSGRWGWACRLGRVELKRRYDRLSGRVEVEGSTILETTLIDPEAISGADIQYVATMGLAHTPAGLRLVQVDPEYTFHKAERGRPGLGAFDPAAWGDGRVAPVHPVSASAAVADIALPRLRYICAPGVPALEGTEKVE